MINKECKYYKFRTMESKTIPVKLPPTEVHECWHPENLNNGRLAMTSKQCNVENKFCPYRPLRVD